MYRMIRKTLGTNTNRMVATNPKSLTSMKTLASIGK